MITISTLVFFFLSAMVLACLLVLLALAQDRRHQIGYLILLFSFIAWDWSLYSLPRPTTSGWIYVLPLIWLILIFRFGFPRVTSHEFPVTPGEPRHTQEALRGDTGRREAITFYFAILLVGLLLTLMFLYTAQFYH
jgi:hypothetical protein